MKTTGIFFFVCLLLLSCGEAVKPKQPQLPFYNTPDFTPHWAGDKDSTPPHTISAFSFVNQNGKTISNKEVAGKIYVANFFFTTCGSICPRMMNNLKKLQQAFPNDTGLIILSHSVLPQMDSVARLKKYEERMGINGRNWWLLTGNEDEIYILARKSYFADEEIGYNRSNKEFLHTENCVLIDGHGRIRGVYNATLELEIDKLITHIKQLRLSE